MSTSMDLYLVLIAVTSVQVMLGLWYTRMQERSRGIVDHSHLDGALLELRDYIAEELRRQDDRVQKRVERQPKTEPDNGAFVAGRHHRR